MRSAKTVGVAALAMATLIAGVFAFGARSSWAAQAATYHGSNTSWVWYCSTSADPTQPTLGPQDTSGVWNLNVSGDSGEYTHALFTPLAQGNTSAGHLKVQAASDNGNAGIVHFTGAEPLGPGSVSFDIHLNTATGALSVHHTFSAGFGGCNGPYAPILHYADTFDVLGVADRG